jgi:hypothetical protein
MTKHEENFEQGLEDMEKANEALDNGKVVESLYYAGKGIVKPIVGVVKDPVGFAKEIISDWLR